MVFTSECLEKEEVKRLQEIHLRGTDCFGQENLYRVGEENGSMEKKENGAFLLTGFFFSDRLTKT